MERYQLELMKQKVLQIREERQAAASLAKEKIQTEKEGRENAAKIAREEFEFKRLKKENEKFLFKQNFGHSPSHELFEVAMRLSQYFSFRFKLIVNEISY